MKMKYDKYDFVVVGGGTAGCAAAYTAGKLGFKTLLIEKNIHLGGAITSGLVIPAMKSSENQINTQFFNDLIAELSVLKGQTTYQGNPGWFNPELCKVALDRLMSKATVEVLFNTSATAVTTKNKRLCGITATSEMLSVYIEASNIIDTTGNCEIFQLANCKFLEDKDQNGNKFQPMSLRFEMAGVDVKLLGKWLLDFDSDREVTTVEEIEGQTHLSTAYTWDTDGNGRSKWALSGIFEDAVAQKVLIPNDTSYFQLFTIPAKPTSIAFNCPRMYLEPETDALDPMDVSKTLSDARESILRLSNFCKIYLPGFENSYISNIADALGVRVSKRIKGKYVYTVDDLRTGKKFKNPVLVGNYPIDVHSNKPGKSVLEHTTQDYQLPVESLMSDEFDNLFVAGRALSADFYAQAALRIQPSCFSMGEGLVKYLAVKK